MRKEPENRAKTPEVTQSTITNRQRSGEVAFMTLGIVKGRITKKVRTLLDCKSQKRYNLINAAKELGLHPLSSEAILRTQFSDTQTKAKSHSKIR